MIIVKSKTTGKFLKHRSGSTRKLKHDTYHDIINDETLSLPEDDGIYYVDVDGTTSPRVKAVSEEIHKRIFSADAIGARQYSSKASVLNSIGVRTEKAAKYVLPDYLELHEIIDGSLQLFKL